MSIFIRRAKWAAYFIAVFSTSSVLINAGIQGWSTTPASNTTLEGISWAEGMAPGNVNDGVRAIAAGIKTYTDLEPFCVAISDETTAITATTGKVTWRMPYAMALTAVNASLTSAQTSGDTFTIDINEGGTTILSTKLTIDNSEKTSTTAAAAAVISDASIANDAEMTIDVDQVGNGTAAGGKVCIQGTHS